METKWKELDKLPYNYQRIIIFDTETTGLNHYKNHIAELSAVEIENGQFTGNQFQIYIKPRVSIESGASSVHGLKDDFFINNYEGYYHNEKDQLLLFLEFIGNDSLLIGHNSTFDYYYLNDELRFYGLPEVSQNRFRCTYKIAKKIIMGKFPDFKMDSYKLCQCCKFFNVMGNNDMFHNALYDSFMTGIVLMKLISLNDGRLQYDDLNFQCGTFQEKSLGYKKSNSGKKDKTIINVLKE